ncbi:MAG: phosphatidate cytidylyltransferase [Propionibacteriaceae bacterium]
MLPDDAPPVVSNGKAGRNLPVAIAVGLGLVASAAVTLAWWNWGFVILTAIALCLAAVEVHSALLRKGAESAIVPILVGTVLIVTGSYYAGHRLHLEHGQLIHMPSNTLLLAGLGVTVVGALVWRMKKGPNGFVKDASASMFIIGYVSLLGSFIALMLAGSHGAARVITFLLCVPASDTGGYIAGVLFGKHQMTPVISPKKTWEGLAGSFILASIMGMIMTKVALHSPIWVGIIFGIVCAAAGTCGDLIESLVKRDVGIKDMSSFLPGHGGVMDRLDSLLVAAPAAWLVLYLLVPGG